ncbi:tyrosine-protein phosphatase [Lysinibacillus telephonicus]|uniref:tyrosine-protein phosphatase n=1 Tax=Lysinibacillus telephonicus TaxID=1714840 RepID=UPI0037D1FF10
MAKGGYVLIDIHSHLLWNEDDGPATMQQTINMLQKAVDEGISDIITTSHFQHPLYSVNFNQVQNKVNLLQMELLKYNIPLKIYTGHEARLSPNLAQLVKTFEVHTLANSKYLLLELPSYSVPLYTFHIVQELLKDGITPIIAHPERNHEIFENPLLLEKLVRNGVLAQITAGSLTGHFGRKVQKFSLDLVKANLIHTYGSDVHNLKARPFLFKEGLCFLEKKGLLDYVYILIGNNKNIIKNKQLIILEPERIKKRRW